MKIVSGTFIASDAAVKVKVGFVPDYVKLWTAIGGTELIIEWFKAMGDTSALTGQYGVLLTPGSVASVRTTANAGIIAYDEVILKALLPSPDGNGEKAATIYGDFAFAKAQNLTPTARTISVIGSVIRPTVKNGFLYECTISAGGMSALTEPTWGTVIGETTSDGTNTWICREEILKNVGGRGFTIGVDIATNGEILCFKAEQHDRSGDMGDADSESPVSYIDD